MKIKRKGNKILSADIEDPDAVIAEFSAGQYELRQQSKVEFVSEHNAGIDMLHAYAKARNGLHIMEVAELLKKMEHIFTAHEAVMFAARMKEKAFRGTDAES